MNGYPSNMNEDDLRNAWRTAALIARFLRKELSTEEEEELNAWKNKSERNRLLFEELTNEKNIENARQWITNLEKEKIKSLESLKEKIPFTAPRKTSRTFRWMIAAAVLLVVVAGAGIFIKNRSVIDKSGQELLIKAGDVAPGGNKAVLQVSDGSIIALTDLQNGIVRNEPGAVISKRADGEIRYEYTDSDLTDIPFNTLTTPIGGQYQIILPDGTKAWLNASSSLKYPVSFKNKRSVEVTGEVYFEVTKDKIPFIVHVKGTKIEVLGTHFNVNAYHLVKTTLFEGSVRIDDNKLLKPGEQATTDKETGIVKLEYPADIVAWKNGYFRFTHENIKEIMDQLGRWYSIDVVFESNPTQTTFTATAKRNENISTILKNIEQDGSIHFKIEGEKITVMP
ncbi:MAG: hypothetical protein JWM28_560 [Chitinophagaceae bacterium]|nr:hypothetical protein [Chitinophagaceae bacterium]